MFGATPRGLKPQCVMKVSCGTAADAPARRSGDNARMQILLNGEPLALDDAPTLSELLLLRGLAGRRVAVEVNGEIVPRGRHGEHRLAEGDRVEIVQAMGGG